MIGTSYGTFLSIKYFWLGIPPADENMTIPLTDCMSYRPFAIKMIVARRDGDVESPATRFSTIFMALASQHPRGCYLRASFYFVISSSSSFFFLFFSYFSFQVSRVISITSTCRCIFCDKKHFLRLPIKNRNTFTAHWSELLFLYQS